MSEDKNQLEFSRRGLLGGLLGAAAITRLPSLGTTSAIEAGVEANSAFPTLYQFLKYSLTHAANLNKNYDYLATLIEQEMAGTKVVIPHLAEDIAYRQLSCDLSGWPKVAQELLLERPGAKEISSFLASPECRQLLTQYNLPGNGANELAGELCQVVRHSPEEMTHLIDLEMESNRVFVKSVEAAAQEQSYMTEEIKRMRAEKGKEWEKANPLPYYTSDGMAWRHKTAGPFSPVSKDGKALADEEQEKLQIGLYARPCASGCEHYGTISSRDEQLRAHYAKS